MRRGGRVLSNDPGVAICTRPLLCLVNDRCRLWGSRPNCGRQSCEPYRCNPSARPWPGFRPFTRQPLSSELRDLEKSRGQLQPLSSVRKIAGRSKEAARDRSAERKMTKMFGHVGRHLIRYTSSDCSTATRKFVRISNSRLAIGIKISVAAVLTTATSTTRQT